MNFTSVENNLTLLELCLHIKSLTDDFYLVGGCVRNMLLNKTPKDFDIVCKLDLDELISVLKDNNWKVSEAGKQFLVLIVSKNNQQFEISLYRKDGTYLDGRRPESVSVGNINTCAYRRDFTINALYFNPFTQELLDPTGKGIQDINNKIIRFIGRPSERINEDFLRIFRAYRQAHTLDFTIERNTLKNMRKYFNEACQKLPPERIRTEIEKFNPNSISP